MWKWRRLAAPGDRAPVAPESFWARPWPWKLSRGIPRSVRTPQRCMLYIQGLHLHTHTQTHALLFFIYNCIFILLSIYLSIHLIFSFLFLSCPILFMILFFLWLYINVHIICIYIYICMYVCIRSCTPMYLSNRVKMLRHAHKGRILNRMAGKGWKEVGFLSRQKSWECLPAESSCH